MAFDLDYKFIKAAEEKLECRFPAGYCHAMAKNNGGGVAVDGEDWRLHPILDSSSRKRIARTCNDVTRETEEMRRWPGWPAQAIAIGADGCGDAIVFLCKNGSCEPEVYIWSHETGSLELVAKDFSELHRTE